MPTAELEHTCPECKFKVRLRHCKSPTCTWVKCFCISATKAHHMVVISDRNFNIVKRDS